MIDVTRMALRVLEPFRNRKEREKTSPVAVAGLVFISGAPGGARF